MYTFSNIIKEKRDLTKKTQAETDKLQKENTKRNKRLPQFGSKVNKINQVTQQHLTGLEQQRLRVNQKLKSLSLKRKDYMKELSQYIFPIEFVEIQNQMPRKEPLENEDVNDDLIADLEDAMSTSYIMGRWVTTSMTDG